ncbi:RHS repeat protein [bacterium]|nr:RHS repeat protein [bacterium]
MVPEGLLRLNARADGGLQRDLWVPAARPGAGCRSCCGPVRGCGWRGGSLPGLVWQDAVPYTHGSRNDIDLITEYGRDKLGRPIKSIDALGRVTSNTYNKAGRLLEQTDPSGVVTAYRYDALGRQTRVIRNHKPTGEDPALWVWDGYWRHIGTPLAVNSALAPNDQNVITETQYDLAGRKVGFRDPNGRFISYTYDKLNRRLSLRNPLGYTWSSTYSDQPDGTHMVHLQDAAGQTTQRHFDKLGRLQGIAYLNEAPKQTPDVQFRYDLLGNRTRMTEWNEDVVVREMHYAYDAAGRLVEVGFDHAGSGVIEENVAYSYDVNGCRTQLVMPDGLSLAYTYDQHGRLSQLNYADHSITYAYDQAGRLHTATHANGLQSQYGYDAVGQLKTLSYIKNRSLKTSFAYSYDARGNRIQAREMIRTGQSVTSDDTGIDYYQGTWSTEGEFQASVDFDAALRTIFMGREISVELGVGPNHGVCDIYLDNHFWGSLDNYAESEGSESTVIQPYHDGAHLLEIRNRPTHNPAASGHKLRLRRLEAVSSQRIAYHYDALSRLIEASYTPAHSEEELWRETYAYDCAGNRTQVEMHEFGVLVERTTARYDAANRLIQTGAHTLTYDFNGNLMTDGARGFTWDRANRLLSTTQDAQLVNYAYNGLGQRVSQSVDGIVTRYLLDVQPGLANVIASTIEGVSTRYVHDPRGILAQQQPDGDWHWMLTDGLGSVREVLAADLGSIHQTQYTPYGSPFGATSPAPPTPFAFTGRPATSTAFSTTAPATTILSWASGSARTRWSWAIGMRMWRGMW